MLLFAGPNLFLLVFAACQRWQNEAMEEKGLDIESNFPKKPTKVFNLPIRIQSHPDYPLSGDNKLPEIRTSLTLKSGWPRPIFPIPR